jgi:hypothetical protein
MLNTRAAVCGLVTAIALVASAFAGAEASAARKSVLLLYAESRVLPAIVRVDESLRARFAEGKVQADFFPEYLDLSWATSPTHATELLTFLRAKHRDRTFDLVIVVGAPALRFALTNRAELLASDCPW